MSDNDSADIHSIENEKHSIQPEHTDTHAAHDSTIHHNTTHEATHEATHHNAEATHHDTSHQDKDHANEAAHGHKAEGHKDKNHTHPGDEHKPHEDKKNILSRIYHDHYKAMMIFSVLLLVFSLGVIGYTYVKTGDFIHKGVSLKGGISLSVSTSEYVNSDQLQAFLLSKFPDSDINVRTSNNIGSSYYSLDIEASDVNQTELVNALKEKLPSLTDSDINPSVIGPAFGASFFVQVLKAIFIAFVFMSLVVYLYFGEKASYKFIAGFISLTAALVMFYSNNIILYIIPIILLGVLVAFYFKDSILSFGIILCAFSDVFFSLAIFNLTGLKLTSSDVVAFLMLVGYSIDTDILLSVRVLKRREGSVYERVIGAMKTGIMMSVAALIAALTAFFMTNSLVIKEIMLILIFGLIGDIIFTWIQNAGILRWHLEKRGWK